MSQEEKRMLTVDQYEYGILIHALNDMRTDLIQEERPTDAVDELLLKTIDAPRKKRGKGDDEAR
jgi:hypothetical protein